MMVTAVSCLLYTSITFDGITTAKAANFLEKENSVPQIDLGPARAGSLEALGIMEYSNAHGKIVCMPTGGAAGIIPAAIKNTAVGLKKSFEEQVKALLDVYKRQIIIIAGRRRVRRLLS